jgi:hypothetical protein
MENAGCDIPEHLQERWGEITRRLAEASLRIMHANEDYHDAIAERLKINTELKEWKETHSVSS